MPKEDHPNHHWMRIRLWLLCCFCCLMMFFICSVNQVIFVCFYRWITNLCKTKILQRTQQIHGIRAEDEQLLPRYDCQLVYGWCTYSWDCHIFARSGYLSYASHNFTFYFLSLADDCNLRFSIKEKFSIVIRKYTNCSSHLRIYN